MSSIDEVLALQLVTSDRRRSIEAKVRQPLGQRADDAGTYVEAVLGGLLGIVVPGAAVQGLWHRLGLVVSFSSRLHSGLLPELADHRAAEICHEADAVGTGHHLVEPVQHDVP